MKKLFAFISILAVCACGLFADVSAKKNADGTVDVTFFYGNPRATEVLLAGDFTSWQDGALPMTKTDKGFTLTRTFKMGEEARYKFISDGNWTTDLRAPDFVDDGFGGKNSHIVIADLVGGNGDDSGAGKAKINFVSWTMLGLQANYRTQGANDATKKGMDLDSVNLGVKSYDKFTGTFLPNAPFYLELVLAETELEDYGYTALTGDLTRQLYAKDRYDNETLEFEDGIKDLISGLVANPVNYFSQSIDEDTEKTGLRSPYIGHLKFGWNTPYINFVTGFHNAKPDDHQAIIWKTVAGSSDWTAGYMYTGGFSQFSLGSKAVAFLEEKTGLTFDVAFAPNKSADRKGYKYGYWGWAGVSKDDFAVEFQTNGMYNGDYIFYQPVEHDFILGAKNIFDVGDGRLSVAAQALLSTHQVDSDKIGEYAKEDGLVNGLMDYFGYSTDVLYRSDDFDGIQNLAGNVQVGYKADTFDLGLEYRLRGLQASMLYLRENHSDGTFDLSETLGNVNTQQISFNGSVTPIDGLSINLGVAAEMALQKLDFGDDEVTGYYKNSLSWYTKFTDDFIDPHFGIDSGAELAFTPEVSYTLEDSGITFGAYADMNYNAFDYTSKWEKAQGEKSDDLAKYAASDSRFRLKVLGASFNYKPDSDLIKGVNVYYGFDLSNEVRYFNTLVGQVKFAQDWTANLAFGLKTENTASADKSFDSDVNNPFAFALGVSKQFKAMKKPIVYAQFVFNMDPFAHFGSGQDNLNMDRANVKGSWAGEGITNEWSAINGNAGTRGTIDAVDWYDGRAAMRVGIRWDI